MSVKPSPEKRKVRLLKAQKSYRERMKLEGKRLWQVWATDEEIAVFKEARRKMSRILALRKDRRTDGTATETTVKSDYI